MGIVGFSLMKFEPTLQRWLEGYNKAFCGNHDDLYCRPNSTKGTPTRPASCIADLGQFFLPSAQYVLHLPLLITSDHC